MDIAKSHIVRNLAGRDKGKLQMVIDTEEEFLLLADGKGRRLEAPKRKKRKHVSFAGESDSIAAKKLQSGEKVLNSEIRKALLLFEEAENGQSRRV